MQRLFGFRALLAICTALAVLLAALAAVQYRWSTRVVAADAQREREHLASAASLFANEFNDAAIKAVEFLQNDAQDALKSGAPLAPPPTLIGELYYIDTTPPKAPVVKRLAADGTFAASTLPDWMPHCAVPIVLDRPPALVSPVYDTASVRRNGASIRIPRAGCSGVATGCGDAGAACYRRAPATEAIPPHGYSAGRVNSQ